MKSFLFFRFRSKRNIDLGCIPKSSVISLFEIPFVFLVLLNSLGILHGQILNGNIQRRFDLINYNTELSIEYNSLIQNQIVAYSKEYDMERVTGVYHFYTPLLHGIFREYNLPIDLTYLALIESRMDFQARSSVGALGAWQIMPKTGASYGLYTFGGSNDFFDPVKSTHGAARFLVDSWKRWNDWNLVIVAYNCGYGNVSKAVRKAGSKNIWKIYPYLPKESRKYIIRLYAMRYLMEYGDYHNFYPKKMKFDYSNVNWYSYKELMESFPLAINDPWFIWLNPHVSEKNINGNQRVYYIP